jgi:hypothetical protein
MKYYTITCLEELRVTAKKILFLTQIFEPLTFHIQSRCVNVYNVTFGKLFVEREIE